MTGLESVSIRLSAILPFQQLRGRLSRVILGIYESTNLCCPSTPKCLLAESSTCEWSPNLPLLMWYGILTGYLVWVMGLLLPSPYYASSSSSLANLTSITAPDKYTVVFTFNQNESEEACCELLQGGGDILNFESPLAVQAYGNVNDWHHAIGTGPFILTDFVDGTAATLVKNPNYWGYDERYPQNQLPYVSGLKVLIIPSQPTALAAVRAGKMMSLTMFRFKMHRIWRKRTLQYYN